MQLNSRNNVFRVWILLFLVVSVIVVFIFAGYFKTMVNSCSLTISPQETRQIDKPAMDLNLGEGIFIYDFVVFKTPLIPTVFRIIPDDTITSLELNGFMLDLSNIPNHLLYDYRSGFLMPSSSAWKNGENTLQIIIRNGGSSGGLLFVHEWERYMDFVIFFIVSLLITFLFVYRFFSSNKNFSIIELAFICVIILSFAIRLVFLEFQSGDYISCLAVWDSMIRTEGSGIYARAFTNYAPLYTYLLGIGTLLPLSPISEIKLFSVIADIIMAAGIMRIVAHIKPCNKNLIIASFSLGILIPTVVINGSLWGQCDSIYSACVIWSILFLMKKNYVKSILFYGLSLAFKLQPIFVFPVFFLLLFTGKIPVKTMLLIPVPFLLSLLPAALAGRGITDLLFVYFMQGDYYTAMTMNAPTIYQWFPNNGRADIMGKAGIIISALLSGVIFIVQFKRYLSIVPPKLQRNMLLFKNRIKLLHFWRSKFVGSFEAKQIIYSFTIFSIIVPFSLPRMHERYFFLADILTVILGLLDKKFALVAFLVISSSFFSYMPFLFGAEPVSIFLLSFIILLAIIILLSQKISIKSLALLSD